MANRIVEARALKDYQLHLRFDDGTEGVVDVQKLVPFDGVFAPLQDRNYFQQVQVEPDFGAIYWPNGADLDPDVLHSTVTGKPIQTSPAQVVK